MDAVVLSDDRDGGNAYPTVVGNVLPAAVRDALPSLFVETALALALIDAEGRLLTVNAGFCALVGRSANALTGARIGDVLHPDDRVAHLAAWHALLGGITRADRVQARLVRPDGTAVSTVVYRTVVTQDTGHARAIGLAAWHVESAPTVEAKQQLSTADFARKLATDGADQASVGSIVARTLADASGDGAFFACVDDDRTVRVLGVAHRDTLRRRVLGTALQATLDDAADMLGTTLDHQAAMRIDGSKVSGDGGLLSQLSEYSDQFGITELVLAPARVGNRIIGVSGVIRDGGAPAYDDDTIEHVAAMTATAALALGATLSVARARADERFARAVLDTMPVMAAVLDDDGRIVDVNEAWMRAMDQYGGPLHTGVGENYLHLWDVAAATGVIGAAEVAGGVRDVLNGERDDFAGDCTYPQLESNGDPGELWFHVHATRLKIERPDGRPMVVVDHQDITDRKRLEVRLSFEATHDPLTRLPNRTLLIDRVEQALTRDRRAGVRTAVLFCDLDYFKQINDQFGHDGGDAVLRAVARRFARTVRASDTVARIGGDEFVVLVESVADLDEALLVADKLVLSLRDPQPDAISNDLPMPGVSVGVAVSDDASTAESLLRDADAAMYTAKQTGRSRVEAASSS